jgi:hypothetical protein
VEQESAKQIKISSEWKKEISNKKIKKYTLSKFLPCFGEEWISSEFIDCTGCLSLISKPGAIPC